MLRPRLACFRPPSCCPRTPSRRFAWSSFCILLHQEGKKQRKKKRNDSTVLKQSVYFTVFVRLILQNDLKAFFVHRFCLCVFPIPGNETFLLDAQCGAFSGVPLSCPLVHFDLLCLSLGCFFRHLSFWGAGTTPILKKTFREFGLKFWRPSVAPRVAPRIGFSHTFGHECYSESCSENAPEF